MNNCVLCISVGPPHASLGWILIFIHQCHLCSSIYSYDTVKYNVKSYLMYHFSFQSTDQPSPKGPISRGDFVFLGGGVRRRSSCKIYDVQGA